MSHFTASRQATWQELERLLERSQGNGLRQLATSDIEALLRDRAAARQNKDFQKADAIRKELADLGVVVMDGPTGTSWRMQVATQQLANTSQLKKVKRDIARVRTVMREKAAK